MGMVLLTFIGCTLFVILFALYKSKKVANDTSDGYFLGGRSLTGGVIAASLLLTNLSATHFVGMTGDVYKVNMSTIGWEITAAVCLVIVAIFLLPRYLKAGLTTIPDFLEDRYDMGTKKLVSYLFILGYLFNMLPITLYAGAVVLNQIFDLQGLLGVSYGVSIVITVVLIGVIGCLYTMFGGLKAVATADSINGILLVLGGLMVPVFGFMALGKGNIIDGIQTVLVNNPEKLNSIGSSTDLLPFATTFTGLGLVVLYFWGTDQAIIQRALAAKNLKEGQKGAIFAGVLKILTPIILMVPGLIAFQMYGTSIGQQDLVYPTLVKDVLPKPLVGIFVAAMFGAILSTFNGVLNSTSTLFAINIYKPLCKKELSDKDTVIIGKKFGLIIAVISLVVAPFLMFTPSGLYTHLQTINGFTNVPILTIVFMGYVNRKAPAISAKISLLFFVACYAIMFFINPPLHYLHRSGILFVICCTFMFIMSRVKPRAVEYKLKNLHVVDMKPWKYRYEVSGALLAVMVCVYILLSPVGLAQKGGCTSETLIYIGIAVVIMTILTILVKRFLSPKDVIFSESE